MSSKELIKLLERNGWKLINVVGSHHQFKHSEKKGRVTIKHPQKDIPKGTLHNIYKQAGLK